MELGSNLMMPSPIRTVVPQFLAIVAIAAAIVGCGAASGPVTYPVMGTVTLGGKPVENAVVAFASAGQAPADAKTGSALGGQARTDAEGHYAMSVVLDRGKTTRQGLPAGNYVVTVTKMEFPGGVQSPTSPPKNVLPPKYGTEQATPLKATVKPDSENKFDFPL
jgi:hypothetical protein